MSERERLTGTGYRPLRSLNQGRRLADRKASREYWSARMNRIGVIGIVAGLVAISLYVLLYVLTGALHMLGVAGCIVVSLGLMVWASWIGRGGGGITRAGYLSLLAIVVAYGGTELLLAGATWYLALGGLLLILLVGSILLPRRWIGWVLCAGLLGSIIWLINRFDMVPRYDVTSIPFLEVTFPGFVGLVVLAILLRVIFALRVGSIRIRLTMAFVFLVLLPAAAISIIASVVSLRSGQRRASEQLQLAAAFQEAEIDDYTESLLTGLSDALSEADAILFARLVLKGQQMADADFQQDLEQRFLRYLDRTQRFDHLILVKADTGQVVVSTDEEMMGQVFEGQRFFLQGLQGPDVSLSTIFYEPVVIAAQPVLDEGQALGALIGVSSRQELEAILNEREGIGSTGKAFLVDENLRLVTNPYLAEYEVGSVIQTEGTEAALTSRPEGNEGQALYEDHRGRLVTGVYRWLPELDVGLVVEQDQAEVMRSLQITLLINFGVAVISVLLAVGVALLITRSIVTPMAELAATASEIASGELDRAVKIEREDEIGALAHAFNTMTVQLRGFIGGLEERVAERTRELERRSAYQDASAEVARAASSILDADQLIRQVVELIRRRFGLYYVGLFLLDESGEWAVLRAGTGRAGQIMMDRGHRIRVGEGMIGWSIAKGQARVALDVGEDAVRLATVELPETRSEAALPLRSRDQILGALTVQSDLPAAFDDVTISVLQTMADQVAVSLHNANLFTEAQAALEATRRAYSEMSREAWTKLLRSQFNVAYRSDERGVVSVDDVWRPEMEQALRSGEIVRGGSQSLLWGYGTSGDGRHPLAVPIKIRGSVVGVLGTHKDVDMGDWTPEEIDLLETLVDQLGVALEGARLYEDAQRRAVREQLTSEITDKMRRATDVEEIITVAVDQLFDMLGTSRVFVKLETDGAAPNGQGDGNEGAGSGVGE